MRWTENGKKTIARMVLAAVLSLGVFATNAMGDSGPGIGLDLTAGVLLTNGDTASPTDIYFKAEVFAGTDEVALPYRTIHVTTPVGKILELEASEDKSTFSVLQNYENIILFRADHGDKGGAYLFVFNRDAAAEDTLSLDYPYTVFYSDFARIVQPVHMNTYVPQQLVASWMLPWKDSWRNYNGIIVELDDIDAVDDDTEDNDDTEDDTEPDGVRRLYTSGILSSRETALDIEKEYGILETDRAHALTVKLVNEITGKAETHEDGVAVDYAMSYYIANEAQFITTPEYLRGPSDGTTCFINAAASGSR